MPPFRANDDERGQPAAATLAARTRTWEVTPDLLSVVDGDGRFRETNPAWQTALGWSAHHLATTPFPDFVHPDDLAPTLAAFDDVKADNPVLRFENRYRHADGTYRWLSWVSVLEGDLIYSTARDVTAERADAAIAAWTAKERDRLWNASPDLYVTIGRDGHYRQASPSWLIKLGWNPDDLVGLSVDALAHPDDRRRVRSKFAKVLEGDPAVDFMLQVRAANGAYHWFSFNVFAHDSIIMAVGHDAAARKERDTELKAAEDALRQAQKLEMIGQLTGGVAHDFNNLLMAVRSNVELAARKLPGDAAETKELLGNALAGISRGATLTQRMLAFARKQELAIVPVCLPDLIRGMRELLVRTLGPSIDVEIEAADTVSFALADQNQVELAILNLAVNARDAIDGAGRLRIAVDQAPATPDAPDGYVRLLVTDDGEGMDDATLAKSMEPFFTTKEIGKGTGLGLSMIHGLAEQSGGIFRLTSVVGVGTTAELLLPAAAADAVAAAQTTAGPGADETSGPIAPLKVLAVDDDALVLMGTVAMLEDMGHEVVSVTSGAAGLAAAKADDSFDLVLTDHAMPKMTGAELARALADLRPDTPILLATGFAEQADLDHSLFVGQLAKPFGRDDLARMLREIATG